MKYLISPNPGSREAVQFAGRLLSALQDAGQQTLLPPEAADALGEPEQAQRWQGEAVDRILVLGGDGTILRQFHRMHKYGAQLWGINFGHLGYLTDCEPDQALNLLPRILKGDYTVEHRTLL